MSFRKSRVVRFAEDRQLDVVGISERAEAAVKDFGVGDDDTFRGVDLEKVMGSKELVTAYEDAREGNSARYG